MYKNQKNTFFQIRILINCEITVGTSTIKIDKKSKCYQLGLIQR